MIDLCIVNYNTPDLLKRLVDNLKKGSAGKNYVTYLADNSDDAEKRNAVKEIENEFDYVVYNDNIGYARACNALANLGNSDIIALLNADVWMTRDHLAHIEDTFRTNDEVAILGPKQMDEAKRIVHGGIVGPMPRLRHRGWKMYDPEDAHFKDFIECPTVSGSAYFIRRSVWEALRDDEEYNSVVPNAEGPFLPTPHYFEETFCSMFARHRGYKVFYDGRVTIGHSWHASSPVNGPADSYFTLSRAMYRKACDMMGIEHE